MLFWIKMNNKYTLRYKHHGRTSCLYLFISWFHTNKTTSTECLYVHPQQSPITLITLGLSSSLCLCLSFSLTVCEWTKEKTDMNRTTVNTRERECVQNAETTDTINDPYPYHHRSNSYPAPASDRLNQSERDTCS